MSTRASLTNQEASISKNQLLSKIRSAVKLSKPGSSTVRTEQH